jgi:predicted DNA-binding WGR domain protein
MEKDRELLIKWGNSQGTAAARHYDKTHQHDTTHKPTDLRKMKKEDRSYQPRAKGQRKKKGYGR